MRFTPRNIAAGVCGIYMVLTAISGRARQFALCIVIAAALSGCAGMPFARTVHGEPQSRMALKETRGSEMQNHKGWLLSRLPKAEQLVQEMLSVLKEYPDEDQCFHDNSIVGCEKVLSSVGERMSQYDLKRLPDGLGRGHFALFDGDTAYVFRITDRTFSGIADLSNALYYASPDVPLRRSDGWSFAFAGEEKKDTETTWTLFRYNITENGGTAIPLGEFGLTRAELDAVGVPKQIDLLTPQQRYERELAKQGMSWRRKAEMRAIRMCSGNREQKETQAPFGVGGKRRHNRTASQEPATTDSTAATTSTTLEGAFQGKAHLNCNTGAGYVVTEDGVVGEVYRLVRNKEDTGAIISSTAKEIAGGIIRYSYPDRHESLDIFASEANREMEMQIESAKGGNKLALKLRGDTGASAGSLLLPGEWYVGPAYRMHGKDISKEEFATYFLRAYRDCAIKDSLGACKNIPDIFMGFLNPLIAEEFVQYVSDHYLTDRN